MSCAPDNQFRNGLLEKRAASASAYSPGVFGHLGMARKPLDDAAARTEAT